jgi:hypothetical protein
MCWGGTSVLLVCVHSMPSYCRACLCAEQMCGWLGIWRLFSLGLAFSESVRGPMANSAISGDTWPPRQLSFSCGSCGGGPAAISWLSYACFTFARHSVHMHYAPTHWSCDSRAIILALCLRSPSCLLFHMYLGGCVVQLLFTFTSGSTSCILVAGLVLCDTCAVSKLQAAHCVGCSSSSC